MEDVWKKVGDAFGWISKSFGYKQARTKIKHSDLDIDLDSKLECVCEEPEKVCKIWIMVCNRELAWRLFSNIASEIFPMNPSSNFE